MSLIHDIAAWKYLLSPDKNYKEVEPKQVYISTEYYLGDKEVSKSKLKHALKGKTLSQYNDDIKYSIEKYGGKEKYNEIKLRIEKTGLYDLSNFKLLRDIYLDEHFAIPPEVLDLANLIIDSYTDYEYKNSNIVKEWHEDKFPNFIDYSTKEAFERKIKNREKMLAFEYSDKWYYENVKNIVNDYIYKNDIGNLDNKQILKYINDLNNSNVNKYRDFAIKAKNDLNNKK